MIGRVLCGVAMLGLCGCAAEQNPHNPGFVGCIYPMRQPLGPDGEKTDARLRDLAFMCGDWGMFDKDHFSEEWWSSASGAGMVGAFRVVNPDGTAALHELMTISAEAEGVFMRLRHFDAKLSPWASEAEGPIVLQLESMREGEAAFRIVSGSKTLEAIAYRLTAEGKLASEVAFTPESGREALRLEMGRVR